MDNFRGGRSPLDLGTGSGFEQWRGGTAPLRIGAATVVAVTLSLTADALVERPYPEISADGLVITLGTELVTDAIVTSPNHRLFPLPQTTSFGPPPERSFPVRP